MPRICVIVLIAALMAGDRFCFTLCLAQETPPSFRVATRLVELTVVAIDKNGNAVTDLKKEDFAIFDKGKPQVLSLFHYEGAPAAPAAAASAPPPSPPADVFTNRTPAERPQERNVTALVLDFLNTEPRNQMFVKAQTTSLLRALAPQTRFAIYLMGRQFRVIHDFTDDMESLRARLEQLSSEMPTQRLGDVEQAAQQAEALLAEIESRKTPYIGAVYRAVQAASNANIAGEINANSTIRGSRTETTLAELEILGRHLAGISGRKSLIWISGGLSMISSRVSTSPDGRNFNPQAGDNLENVIRKTSEHLAQLGVALYAVDARGLVSSAETLAQIQELPDLPGRYSEMARAATQMSDGRAAFSLMTTITGGRYIFGTNDLSEGVKKAAGDLRGSYSLGFYSQEEPDGKWHSLKVMAHRPDIHLLCKEGYLADPSPAKLKAWNTEAQQQAMMAPLGSNDIRLTARCVAPPAGAASGTILLQAQIEAEDLFWRDDSGHMIGAADIYIGEKTADGKVRFQASRLNAKFLPQQLEAARTKGLPFRRQWQPGADTISIRILVRDTTTGRMGSVDIPQTRFPGR